MARNAPGFAVPEKDFRAGKRVRGPGGIDRVPAALTAGEFVLKKPAARKLGYANLNHMNQTGEIPMRMAIAKAKKAALQASGRMRMRYQTGGAVDALRRRREQLDQAEEAAVSGTPVSATPATPPTPPMNDAIDISARKQMNQGVIPGMFESIRRRFFRRGGAVGLRKAMMGGGGAHPGFKAVQAKIAAKQGIPMKRAGAILAASSRRASPAAKRRNPRLLRVSGA
jgi:hypothetical protein